MQLILAHTAYCDTEQPHALLAELGFPRADGHTGGDNAAAGTHLDDILADGPDPGHGTLGEPSDAATLEKSVQATERTHMVAFYTPPAHAIAEAITDPDTTLDNAIQRWSDSARILLKVLRKNRKRVTLFDATATAQDPQACADALTECLGQIDRPEKLDLANKAADRNADPLHLVIAHQAVAQSPELQDLYGELEASAQPLGAEVPSEPDGAQALQALREQEAAMAALRNDRDQKQEEVSQMSEENELLLLQLHQVQEELETYYLELQNKENENTQLAFRRRQLERTEQRMRGKIDKEAFRRRQLERTERRMRGKLEKEAFRRRQLIRTEQRVRRSLEKTQRERDQAREALRDLKSSTSWRWTRPLRAIKIRLSGKGSGARNATSAKA